MNNQFPPHGITLDSSVISAIEILRISTTFGNVYSTKIKQRNLLSLYQFLYSYDGWVLLWAIKERDTFVEVQFVQAIVLIIDGDG